MCKTYSCCNLPIFPAPALNRAVFLRASACRLGHIGGQLFNGACLRDKNACNCVKPKYFTEFLAFTPCLFIVWAVCSYIWAIIMPGSFITTFVGGGGGRIGTRNFLWPSKI